MFAKAKYVQCSLEANRGCIMGCRQDQSSLELSYIWPRHESTLTVTMVLLRSDRENFYDLEPIKGNSKPSVDVATELGHHELIMGHKVESHRQTLGYMPTPGLISLFTKTGVRCPNPKHQNFCLNIATAPTLTQFVAIGSRVVRRRTIIRIMSKDSRRCENSQVHTYKP
jgi:hypothetical protein